ncbi:MAG: hypothetical protein ABL923_13245 [Burkholderiaceae bacterium]
MKYSNLILWVATSAVLLTACSGGEDSSTEASTTETSTSTPATPATPSTVSSLYGGTYTGNVAKDTLTASYEGPLSLTLTRDITGSYVAVGTLKMTRSVVIGAPTSTEDTVRGALTSDGAFSATGNINLVSITGSADAATGKITGTYVYKTGSASTFTGNFSVTK